MYPMVGFEIIHDTARRQAARNLPCQLRYRRHCHPFAMVLRSLSLPHPNDTPCGVYSHCDDGWCWVGGYRLPASEIDNGLRRDHCFLQENHTRRFLVSICHSACPLMDEDYGYYGVAGDYAFGCRQPSRGRSGSCGKHLSWEKPLYQDCKKLLCRISPRKTTTPKPGWRHSSYNPEMEIAGCCCS